MEWSWTSALFGAFGISLLKLIWDIVKYLLNRKDSMTKSEKSFKAKQIKLEALFNTLMVSSIDIQKYIDTFRLEYGATRILISKLSNGGDLPQLGAHQYTSILYESIESYENELKSVLQNYQVDPAHNKLVLDTLENDVHHYKIEDIDDGSFKNLLLSNDTKIVYSTNIMMVPSTDDKKLNGFLIYMIIEFSCKVRQSPKLDSDIQLLKHAIHQKFKQFYLKRLEIIQN